MRSWVKRVGLGSLVLAVLGVVLVVFATESTKMPGEEITPSALRRSMSIYLKMRDGVEIAVSVYLPPDLNAHEKVPVLMRTTRYWREPRIGWLARRLVALHLIDSDDLIDKQVMYFNSRRFAVVLVDARGSGASGGRRAIEFSPAEVADIGEIASWAAQQPWSNSHIGTFGISYEGNTAELATVPNHPAIRAVMPLYDTFDLSVDGLGAGGQRFQSLLRNWGNVVAALDRNDVCGADEVKGWSCWKERLITPGVRPVDTDADGRHLAELVKQHHNLNVGKASDALEFRDDAIVTEEGEITLLDISPAGMHSRIEASKVPMMVWEGWLDGDDTDGALIRYRNFSNPQVLVIGPLSHGGDFNVDPFTSKHLPPVPSVNEQWKMEADFFDRLLRDPQSEPPASSIQYYTMGEGQWNTTTTWPPLGMSLKRLYFSDQNSLRGMPPAATTASDSYTVDFTSTTGKQTRWHTSFNGSDVEYPDRAQEDQKLLVYTSLPLENDLEVTGTPVLTLEMSSSATDGALQAYLESVAPSGRVTYLDEGNLRLVDRKEANPHFLPYIPLGPAHSYLRKDAEPLKPGQPESIRLSLHATSVLLRKGCRIRVALAGADSDVFQRYPAEEVPTWTVFRENLRSSFIELPVKKR